MKDLGRQVYLGGEHTLHVTVAVCSFPQGPLLCLQPPCDGGWLLAGLHCCLPKDISAGQLHRHRPNVAGTWTWTWSSTDHSSLSSTTD